MTPIQQPETWTPGISPDKRKVRFLHNAHRFTLFLRERSPYWYVKFKMGGRQLLISLNSTDWKVAKKRAIARFDQAQAGQWEPKSAAPEPPAKPFALFGTIIDRYEEGITLVNTGISTKTASSNSNSLQRLLALCRPDTEIRELSTVILTEELLTDFGGKYLAPAGGDFRKRESRKRGGASVLRQARAVFSLAAMKLYADLRLPDLKAFHKARIFDPKAALVIETPAETIAAIAKAAMALRSTDPALYLSHLCYRHLGMRNIEIEAARWSWITDRETYAGWMVIDQTADFDPKGSLGRVPIAIDVMEELASFRRGYAPDDHIIPAPNATDRHDIVYRRHSEWLKPFLDQSSAKTNYRLRKWAGDTIRMKYNEDASRAFLRHADGSVAGKHYWSGYNWAILAKVRGDDPLLLGITFTDCGLK